jgi:hypothetical protein
VETHQQFDLAVVQSAGTATELGRAVACSPQLGLSAHGVRSARSRGCAAKLSEGFGGIIDPEKNAASPIGEHGILIHAVIGKIKKKSNHAC